MGSFPLSVKIAQKPFILGFSGPKALKYEYESFEGKGKAPRLLECGVFNPKPKASKDSEPLRV